MSRKFGPGLVLKPGREKSLLRYHPWIYSGAVAHVDSNADAGETVSVLNSKGVLLGYGAFSPISQIRCRMWFFADEKHQVTDYSNEQDLVNLISLRLQKAKETRELDVLLKNTNAYRLVHGESDQLPGLIVDIFGKTAVLQLLSSGVERYREEIVKKVVEMSGVTTVFERSDAEVRELEGLPIREGQIFGERLADRLVITENGIKYFVNYSGGQKTGFYLDQRENRLKLRGYAEGKEVLDCFSYSGGFSLNALAGKARSVTALDNSEEALSLLKENAVLNKFEVSKINLVQSDAFKQLRLFRDQGQQFDLIILDPPKFAPTRKQVQSAARGYKDINLLAMKLLRPGGILFTFSCSGGVDPALFQKIIAGAAVDAGVNLQIMDRMTQSSDHPVLTSFPEGEYLKGLICRKL